MQQNHESSYAQSKEPVELQIGCVTEIQGVYGFGRVAQPSVAAGVFRLRPRGAGPSLKMAAIFMILVGSRWRSTFENYVH